jgi:hypothetical protein
MSLDEQLASIDQEIRTLHEFCVNKGYDPWKLGREAAALLSPIRKAKLRRQAALAGKVAIAVAVIAIICRLDPIYRFLLMLGRLSSIQVGSVCI